VSLAPWQWSKSGIILTPYQARDFQSKIATTPIQGVNLAPLYPFSFFLTNNTGHRIISYAALWTVTLPSGPVLRHHRVAGSLETPDGAFSIPDGADRLVTIVNGAGVMAEKIPTATSGIAARIAEDLDGAEANSLKMFPVDSDVEITLEAVVLDDGTALGPDHNQAIPRLRAQVDAKKTLSSDVLEAFRSGGNTAVIDLLTNIVSHRNEIPTSLAASRMSSPDEAYSAFLSALRNDLAVHYLDMAKFNPTLLLRRANATLSQPSVSVHF
jgi:hypothetical protein